MDRENGAVGNIRIKEPKKKKKSVKKTNDTSFGVKVLVWVMFFAMVVCFMGPLAMYLISIISQS